MLYFWVAFPPRSSGRAAPLEAPLGGLRSSSFLKPDLGDGEVEVNGAEVELGRREALVMRMGANSLPSG